eukprot:scaffold1986_cov110-Cylindrotheca_fusiformis.AAC.1
MKTRKHHSTVPRASVLCKSLKEVDIPSTVKWIGDHVFKGCTRLERLGLHEGLERIGEFAFRGCEGLMKIDIPSTVKVIGNNAFKKFVKVFIPSTVKVIGISAFEICTNLERLGLNEGLVIIDGWSFNLCKALNEVDIPSTDAHAWRDSVYMKVLNELENSLSEKKEVDIPSTVKGIRCNAFKRCTRLERLDFNEGLERIGKFAFRECEFLKEVDIPSTVKVIGINAFEICTSLERLGLNGGLAIIDGWSFNLCKSLKEVDIPSTVKGIGDHAFKGCTRLERLGLHEVLERIEEVDIPSTVLSELKEVDIPPTVNRIGISAFEMCTSLERLSLHEGPERIGEFTFKECECLKEVFIPSTVK